jgi:hypothetical protein
MGYRQQKVKKEHSILSQGKGLLEAIAKAPGVTRVIPGRIKAGHVSRGLYCTLQYRTEAGFKLLMHTGSTQEVFVVSQDPDATEAWLRANLPQQRPE